MDIQVLARQSSELIESALVVVSSPQSYIQVTKLIEKHFPQRELRILNAGQQ
ncbi:hypothetical protein H2508_04985 [Parahaliea sp. F7430]|uniref:Uncharacterized protein n=1 Tax=Sediminihaliea albiluteola TaxID=2758564 RepID=A0A7W2YJB8_9GAMM|nr:hypothetical protein [Sediminihaliea albiluteola]MBA6412459.1 hypothetical protein [Sediminihaliea albiluteola]